EQTDATEHPARGRHPDVDGSGEPSDALTARSEMRETSASATPELWEWVSTSSARWGAPRV
ncbi:MAG: hypothetical protein M3Z97_06150, partial [Candidatus Dormibacteraeota bacterium]|nr:hypothetical protein [Candidatus Dormibacteraeota bacterium]